TGLAAHEYVEGSITGVRPSVDRNMALGQNRHPGYAVRLEMVQVDMQEGRLGRGDATPQRCLDQIDAVEIFGSVQINDQMHAGATHAVAKGKMVLRFRGHRLDDGNVSSLFSGGALGGAEPQGFARSQEGVLAHRRPPQPSDPTRVPTSGATASECRRSARSRTDHSGSTPNKAHDPGVKKILHH